MDVELGLAGLTDNCDVAGVACPICHRGVMLSMVIEKLEEALKPPIMLDVTGGSPKYGVITPLEMTGTYVKKKLTFPMRDPTMTCRNSSVL